MAPWKMIKTTLSCFLIALAAGSCNFPYQPTKFVTPAPVYDFSTKAAMQSFTGTSNVKIAYSLAPTGGFRTIYFIDYTSGDSVPTARQLNRPAGADNMHCDRPIISPDGSWVIYYLTQGATVNGAYLQKLDTTAQPVLVSANGTEPRWWKDAGGQYYIIYSDQLMSTALDTGAGKTYRRQVTLGATPVIGAEEQIAHYPMNGGMSADGNYLCTGYMCAAFYYLPGSSLIPINQGMQTCNPSIDPDPAKSGVMMFLNFSGKQNLNNPFIGNADFPDSNLAEHSMLFIVDKTNTVVDYVPLSAAISSLGISYEEWQTPAWSNNANFAAALGGINETAYDGIIIKNMGNGGAAKRMLKFTTGSGGKLNSTSRPYIWVGN